MAGGVCYDGCLMGALKLWVVPCNYEWCNVTVGGAL